MRSAFAHGIINAHAGDLPRFRGNACPNWAILNGENKVVLTLHKMNLDLDAGSILLKRHIPLTDSTYIGDVYQFLDQAIPTAFVEVFARMENGPIVFVDQSRDLADSLRCFPRVPADSKINWNFSAIEISKLVRASSKPFAGAYALLMGERLIIWRARTEKILYPSLGVCGQVVRTDADQGEVWILCGEGMLVLEQVEYRGVCSKATDIINSTRTRLDSGDFCSEQLQALRRRLEALERFVCILQGEDKDDR